MVLPHLVASGPLGEQSVTPFQDGLVEQKKG